MRVILCLAGDILNVKIVNEGEADEAPHIRCLIQDVWYS